MTPRARQVRLMRSLGFKLADRGPGTPPNWSLWWDHPSGARVGFLPNMCPTASEVVSQAVENDIKRTLSHVRAHIEEVMSTSIDAIKPCPKDTGRRKADQ